MRVCGCLRLATDVWGNTSPNILALFTDRPALPTEVGQGAGSIPVSRFFYLVAEALFYEVSAVFIAKHP